MPAEKDQSMKKTSAYTRREFMKQMALGAGMIMPLSVVGFTSNELISSSIITIRRLPYNRVKNQHGAKVKVFAVGESGQNAILRLFNETGRIDGTIEYILIDAGTSKGLVGRPALSEEQSKEIIKDIIDDSHLVFILAGLGQDATTGVVPVLSDFSKKKRALGITVVSAPEIEDKRHNILYATQRLKSWCHAGDCIIKIPGNNSSNPINKRHLFSSQSFDMLMAEAVSGICQTIFSQGLTCLDFADIKLFFEGAKDVSIGIGWGQGEKRAITAINYAWNDLISRKKSIVLSRGVMLFLITNEDFTFNELEDGIDMIYHTQPSLLQSEFTWASNVNRRIKKGAMQAIIYGC